MTKQLLQKALDALEQFATLPGVGHIGWKGIAAIAELREAIAAPEPERVAWESTTEAYTKYVTQSRYDNFRPETQRWYKPICQKCTAPPDAEALRKELEQVRGERDAMEKRLNWIRRNLFGHKWNGLVDSGSQTKWDIWSGYRHETAKMIGNTFQDAIDAAIAAQGEGE